MIRLTASRNQCAGCLELFNSTSAFEKHRVGEFNKQPSLRRCLTVDEMIARDMVKNAAGFWVTAPMPASILASHDQNGEITAL
jgi:hypothetical protein